MWGEISVCAVGLHWSEERWDMSMCAAVHMKATWLSPALWFMPLITTTQRCFQQQQSSAEGWQQWDTCQSGDEKISCYVAVSFVTLIYIFFLCFVYLSPYVSLYLMKCYWWSKSVRWSQFSISHSLPPPVRRWQCASLTLLWLINRLISASLSFSLWYSYRKKYTPLVWFVMFYAHLLWSFWWFILYFFYVIWTAQLNK